MSTIGLIHIKSFKSESSRFLMIKPDGYPSFVIELTNEALKSSEWKNTDEFISILKNVEPSGHVSEIDHDSWSKCAMGIHCDFLYEINLKNREIYEMKRNLLHILGLTLKSPNFSETDQLTAEREIRQIKEYISRIDAQNHDLSAINVHCVGILLSAKRLCEITKEVEYLRESEKED